MKPFFLVAASLGFAPLVCAQDAPDYVPAPKTLTETDARQASALLIKAVRHYEGLKTYEVVINRVSNGGGVVGIAEKDFVRLRWMRQKQNVQFMLTQKLSNEGWTKSIFDGQSVVTFGSDWGKEYERRAPRPNAKAIIGAKVDAELVYGYADGPLIWMLTGSRKLTDRFTASEVDLLKRFDVTSDGALKKINIVQSVPSRAGTPITNSLEIWINPETLMVEKSRQYDTFKGTITENYTQQRFNPAFANGSLRAVAPLNYKLRD